MGPRSGAHAAATLTTRTALIIRTTLTRLTILYRPCLPCSRSCACRQVGLNDSLGHCEVLLEQCVPGVPKALNLPLSTKVPLIRTRTRKRTLTQTRTRTPTPTLTLTLLSTQGTLELVLTYTPSGMETSAAALAFAQGKSAFGRRGSNFGTRRFSRPGETAAAGTAAAAFGSPQGKGRRLSLTPASVSRVKCFITASPGDKLSQLKQALPQSPASRRASRASDASSRYSESSAADSVASAPGAAPSATPGDAMAAAMAAAGIAPAAGAPAAAPGKKARLASMLNSSEAREERRHRRKRLAAMIAAAKAAVEAGQTDLGALAWGGVRVGVQVWGLASLALTVLVILPVTALTSTQALPPLPF